MPACHAIIKSEKIINVVNSERSGISNYKSAKITIQFTIEKSGQWL